MLTKSNSNLGKTDRAFARSALQSPHSWPFNISIRAKFGESTIVKQKALNFTIDKRRLASYYFAIEWPAIYKTMSEMEKINVIEIHRKSCPNSFVWFAGIRIAPRIHPWDEMNLPYSTRAWIDIQADTTEEAQRIVQKLFAFGYCKSPLHINSSSGKHVFAYTINTEFQN